MFILNTGGCSQVKLWHFFLPHYKKKIFTLLWRAHCLKLQAQPNRQNKCCDVCSFKLPKHFAYIVWLGLGTKNPLGLGKIRFWLKIPWFCHRKHNKFFSHAPKISSVFTLTNIKTQYSNTCLLPLASPPPHNMKVSSCRCNMVYMTWYHVIGLQKLGTGLINNRDLIEHLTVFCVQELWSGFKILHSV